MPNTLVAEFRASNPNDPRSDADLTILLGDRFAGALDDNYPDFAQQYRELSLTRREREAGPILSEIPRGLAHGTDIAQSKLYDTSAQAGRFLGSKTLEDFGRRGSERNIAEAQENAPTISLVEDIDSPSRLARYVAGLSAQVPQLGASVVGAGVGGGIGFVTGGVPGAVAGAAVGGGLTSYTQTQNYGELIKQGVDPDTAASTALGVGLTSAALETIVPLKIVRKFIPGATRQVADAYIRRVIRDVPTTAFLESGTEQAQEIAAMAGELHAHKDNPRFQLTNKEIFSRLINAGVPGFLLGGAVGAVEAIPAGGRVPEAEAQAEEAPAPPLQLKAPPLQLNAPAFTPEVSSYVQEFEVLPPEQKQQLLLTAGRQAAGLLTMGEQGEIAAILSTMPAGVRNAYNLIVASKQNELAMQEGVSAGELEAAYDNGVAGTALPGVATEPEGELEAAFDQGLAGTVATPARPEGEIESAFDAGLATPMPQGEAELPTGTIIPFPPAASPSPARVAAVSALRESPNPRKPKVAPAAAVPVSLTAIQKVQEAPNVLLSDIQKPSPAVTSPALDFLDTLDVEGGATDATGSWWEPLEDGTPSDLTKGARSDDRNGNKNATKRGVFVRENATGKVWLLGVYDNRGVKITNPAKKTGTDLKKFLAGKKFTVLASVRLKTEALNLKKGFSPDEYAAIETEALAKLVNQRSTTAAMMDDMGQIKTVPLRPGVKQGAPPAPVIDLAGEANDMVLEALPRDPNGKIKQTLTQQEVREALAWAFLQPQNIAARSHVLGEAYSEIGADPAFQALDNEGKLNKILEWSSRRIYERHEKSKALAATGRVVEAEKLIAGIFGEAGQGYARDSGSVRYRVSPVESGRQDSEAQVKGWFRTALHSLQAAGANLQIFQQRLDGLVNEFTNREGGAYQNLGRMITLVMRDTTNPSRETFITLLHEAVHDLIAQETNQEAIHRAIDAWGAKVAPDQNPEEAFAEALAQQGVENLESGETAQGLAAALWRKVKELYHRVAMFIQESMWGQASPSMAESYFENRLEQLAAGDNQNSFIWWLGGAKPTPEEKAINIFTPADGGWRGGIYNIATGMMEYGAVVPDSALAAEFNLQNAEVKFRRKETLIDEANPGAEAKYGGPDATPETHANIAVYNELEMAIGRVYAAWTSGGLNPAGLTQAEFRAQILGSDDHLAMATDLAQRHTDLGYRPPNMGVLFPQVDEGLKKSAARRALFLLNNIRTRLTGRVSLASKDIKSLQAGVAARAQRERNLLAKFRQAEHLAERIVADVRGIVAVFHQDIRRGIKSGYAHGVISQHITEILAAQEALRVGGPPTISTPRAAEIKNYERAISDLAAKITGKKINFMATLRSLAKLKIDWKNSPMTEVIRLIEIAAGSDAQLRPLTEKTTEGRALLAVATGWAKVNDGVMAFMELDLANDIKAEGLIRQMVEAIDRDSTANLSHARAALAKVIGKARLAERIFEHYAKVKAENQEKLNTLKDAQAIVAFAQAGTERLRLEAARFEEMIGAQRDIDLTHGTKLFVAPRPNATDTEVEESTRTFSLSDASTPTIPRGDMLEIIQKNRAWLAFPGRIKSEMALTIERQTVAMEMEMAEKMMIPIKSSAMNHVIGSIADRLIATGTPIGRKLGQRFRTYVSLVYRFDAENGFWATKFANAYGDAMAATGIKSRERFHDIFYRRALKYFEDRKDLRDGPDPQGRALQALHHDYLNNPETAALLAKPGTWEKLEKLYRATAKVSSGLEKTRGSMGIPVEDDILGMFRDVIGSPLFSVQRSVHKDALALYFSVSTKPAWQEALRIARLKPARALAEILDAYQADPAAFQANAASMFTPDVLERFAKPMALRRVRSMFSAPTLKSGTVPLASPDLTARAYRESGGDMVVFAKRLYALHGGSAVQTEAQFVAETFDTFYSEYATLASLYADRNQTNTNGVETVPRQLMNGRVSEGAPAEWLDYQTYEPHNTRVMVNQLSMHAAFGRDFVNAKAEFELLNKELSDKVTALGVIRSGIVAANPTATDKKIDLLVEAEVKRTLGANEWKILQNAPKHLENVRKSGDQFTAWFNSQSGGIIEAKAFLEVLNALTSMVVQGPSTALVQTIQMFDPITSLGVSRQALKMVGRNWSGLVGQVFGTFTQMFGHQLNFDAEYMLRQLDLGMHDPDTTLKLKEQLRGIIESDLNIVTKTARTVQQLTRTGISPVVPLDAPRDQRLRFASAKPLAMFTQFSQWMKATMINGVWKTYEDVVTRAVQYAKAHPGVLNNPGFEFTPAVLGYKAGWVFDDAKAFKFMEEGLWKWGMDLKRLTQAALERQAASGGKDTSLFTIEQYGRLAAMANTEINSEANVVNRPVNFFSNPVLRSGVKLLSWSVSRVETLRKTFREPNGQASYKAMLNGMKILGVLMPLGVAYAFLLDKYGEHVTGKKPNIRGFGSENNFLAFVEQTARVGTFGIFGDVANSIGNLGSGGDLRGVSLDSRVLFMNSTIGLFGALTNLLLSEEATYATVYRPLIQALGGGAVLQDIQILNKALSLSNKEAEVTARINVGNYLRSAGRALGMDVRTSRGGLSSIVALPNEIKPWVSEMALSAYANEVGAFYAAYQRAIEAATKAGKPDPAEYVRRSYQSSHPLRSVFATPPSAAEYELLLREMSGRGEDNVRTAVQSYNSFGELIGLQPYTGKVEKKTETGNVLSPSRSGMESIRMRALGGGSLLFAR